MKSIRILAARADQPQKEVNHHTSSFFLLPSSFLKKFSHLTSSFFLLPSSFPKPSSFIKRFSLHTSSFFLLPSSFSPAFSPAFTLIELLVVIAIIGILAGIVLASVSGGSDAARTARCLTNMKNLASACQSYGADTGHYPPAGSFEYMEIGRSSRGAGNVSATYYECPGWISWNSAGAYRNGPKSHVASSSWMLSTYTTDDDQALYCLTNGAIWKYVSGNRETYVCPLHRIKKGGGTKIAWSYLMNAYFGWDTSEGSSAKTGGGRIGYAGLASAEKILLFSEIPFDGTVGSWQPDTEGAGKDCDCVLQFDTSVTANMGGNGKATGGRGGENIGFNHKNGKQACANIVFADGHVEKLRLPKGGMSDSQLRELTAWLCKGVDVSFDGSQYLKNDN